MMGVTLRHPRKVPGVSTCVTVSGGARLMMFNSCVHNDGATGSAILVRESTLRLFGYGWMDESIYTQTDSIDACIFI